MCLFLQLQSSRRETFQDFRFEKVCFVDPKFACVWALFKRRQIPKLAQTKLQLIQEANKRANKERRFKFEIVSQATRQMHSFYFVLFIFFFPQSLQQSFSRRSSSNTQSVSLVCRRFWLSNLGAINAARKSLKQTSFANWIATESSAQFTIRCCLPCCSRRCLCERAQKISTLRENKKEAHKFSSCVRLFCVVCVLCNFCCFLFVVCCSNAYNKHTTKITNASDVTLKFETWLENSLTLFVALTFAFALIRIRAQPAWPSRAALWRGVSPY